MELIPPSQIDGNAQVGREREREKQVEKQKENEERAKEEQSVIQTDWLD